MGGDRVRGRLGEGEEWEGEFIKGGSWGGWGLGSGCWKEVWLCDGVVSGLWGRRRGGVGCVCVGWSGSSEIVGV